jgi:hypothetical protein
MGIKMIIGFIVDTLVANFWTLDEWKEPKELFIG